jgi:hypothetical protein
MVCFYYRLEYVRLDLVFRVCPLSVLWKMTTFDFAEFDLLVKQTEQIAAKKQ